MTRHTLIALATCFAVSACGNGDVKEKLGLNHVAPDEFRVVARPPLSMPPEFNLRPPGEDQEFVSGKAADVRGRDVIVGTQADAGTLPQASTSSGVRNLASTAVTPVSSGPLLGTADAQLLSRAGADKAHTQIRQQLLNDSESGVAAQDSRYLFGGTQSADPQVDAQKEASRIKQNKQQGQSASAGGDTPVIQQKDKGLLGGIF